MVSQWSELCLVAQAGANNIAITDEFYKRVEQIKKDLPADIKTGIGFDVTTYIKDSIKEVEANNICGIRFGCI